MFALDVLLDPDIPIVTLVGKAGCGKTLLAIAAGLDQVLEENRYKKLVVSRPVQPLGKDIGYLPGTMEEKMRPWLMPIQDNIDHLLNGKKDNMSMFFDNGTIQIEALTYIRGRSISNAFIIIDEAQNLTIHELKTIITRVGENTKIVLTGDIEQIDSVYLDSTSNGLSYAVEKFKSHDLSGHMTLIKGREVKSCNASLKGIIMETNIKNLGENPTLSDIVEPENDLKNLLVEYTGEKTNPQDQNVTVEMIIDVMAEEFPEFLLAIAEENWIRGYHQALEDVETGMKYSITNEKGDDKQKKSCKLCEE
jgi:hypothetical protein